MIMVSCFIFFNGFASSLQTFSRWELMGIPKKFIMVSSQWNLNISCTAFWVSFVHSKCYYSGFDIITLKPETPPNTIIWFIRHEAHWSKGISNHHQNIIHVKFNSFLPIRHLYLFSSCSLLCTPLLIFCMEEAPSLLSNAQGIDWFTLS